MIYGICYKKEHCSHKEVNLNMVAMLMITINSLICMTVFVTKCTLKQVYCKCVLSFVYFNFFFTEQ